MSVRGMRAGRTHWLVALGKPLCPFALQFLHWMIEGKSGVNLDNMRIVKVPPFVLFEFSEVINIKHLGDCLAHSQCLADISSGGGDEEPLNMHQSPRGPGESVCGKHWSLPAHVRAQRPFTRFIIFIIPSSYHRLSIPYLQLQN